MLDATLIVAVASHISLSAILLLSDVINYKYEVGKVFSVVIVTPKFWKIGNSEVRTTHAHTYIEYGDNISLLFRLREEFC
jgi:hypothetical protein